MPRLPAPRGNTAIRGVAHLPLVTARRAPHLSNVLRVSVPTEFVAMILSVLSTPPVIFQGQRVSARRACHQAARARIPPSAVRARRIRRNAILLTASTGSAASASARVAKLVVNPDAKANVCRNRQRPLRRYSHRHPCPSAFPARRMPAALVGSAWTASVAASGCAQPGNLAAYQDSPARAN